MIVLVQYFIGVGRVLADNSGLQIDHDGSWNMFSRSSFAEKRWKCVVAYRLGYVARTLTVRRDSVLQAVQFPTGVAYLHACLADMDGQTLALKQITNFSRLDRSPEKGTNSNYYLYTTAWKIVVSYHCFALMFQSVGFFQVLDVALVFLMFRWQ